jgi:hypothetical protein
MKTLELNQMEMLEGGGFWQYTAGVACGVGVVAIIGGSALVSSGLATPAAVALVGSLGLHSCVLGAIS